MRTISIQADGDHLDRIMEEWLARLVMAIPVGPHGITPVNWRDVAVERDGHLQDQ